MGNQHTAQACRGIDGISLGEAYPDLGRSIQNVKGQFLHRMIRASRVTESGTDDVSSFIDLFLHPFCAGFCQPGTETSS